MIGSFLPMLRLFVFLVKSCFCSMAPSKSNTPIIDISIQREYLVFGLLFLSIVFISFLSSKLPSKNPHPLPLKSDHIISYLYFFSFFHVIVKNDSHKYLPTANNIYLFIHHQKRIKTLLTTGPRLRLSLDFFLVFFFR